MARFVFNLDYVKIHWGSFIAKELETLISTIVGDENCVPCELCKLGPDSFELIKLNPLQLHFDFKED